MTPEELAVLFHDTYERLAPSFGYETRTETRQFNPDTPNGRLMIAVCGEVLATLHATPAEQARAALVEAVGKYSAAFDAWNKDNRPFDSYRLDALRSEANDEMLAAYAAYLAALERTP